jgi:hypothetical protein
MKKVHSYLLVSNLQIEWNIPSPRSGSTIHNRSPEVSLFQAPEISTHQLITNTEKKKRIEVLLLDSIPQKSHNFHLQTKKEKKKKIINTSSAICFLVYRNTELGLLHIENILKVKLHKSRRRSGTALRLGTRDKADNPLPSIDTFHLGTQTLLFTLKKKKEKQ